MNWFLYDNEKLNLEHRPDLIWNCDESGLPHELSKLKIISRRGQKTLLVKKVFCHFLKACIKARTSFQVLIYKKRSLRFDGGEVIREVISEKCKCFYVLHLYCRDSETVVKGFETF